VLRGGTIRTGLVLWAEIMVALIVQLDDVGLALSGCESPVSQRTGRVKVLGVPERLGALSFIGTAAMLWVAGLHVDLSGHRTRSRCRDGRRGVTGARSRRCSLNERRSTPERGNPVSGTLVA